MTAQPPVAQPAKPTVADLGIDPATQRWQRSGDGAGAIEIAFTHGPAPTQDTEWVLMRVAGDPAHRVLVFDRHEWECFLDGARNGEFDDATDAATDGAMDAAAADAIGAEPS